MSQILPYETRSTVPFVLMTDSAHGAVADGSEDAFDWIGRPDMPPVLGREVVEGQQGRRGPLSSRRRLGGIWRRTWRRKYSSPSRPRRGHPPSRYHAGQLWRPFVATSPACSRHWLSCGPSSAGGGCRERSPPAPSRSPERHRRWRARGPIVSPRPRRHASNSRQLWALSRTPAWKPTSSLRPSGVAPMRTRMHCFSSSSRPWR